VNPTVVACEEPVYWETV